MEVKMSHTIQRKLLFLFNFVFGISVMMYIFSGGRGSFAMWPVAICQFIFFVMLNILFIHYIFQFTHLPRGRNDGFWGVLVIFLTGISNILLFASVYYFIGIEDWYDS